MPHRALRVGVLAAAAALTAFAAIEIVGVLSPKGMSTLEVVAVALFLPCFAWGTMGALIALVGLAAALLEKKGNDLAGAEVSGAISEEARTAVLVPIHNEDAASVLARVEEMFRALQPKAAGHLFDFFLLSDSTRADVWLDEQETWRSACDCLGAYGRIFYRRRARNEGKKAGNIRDFCLNHGRDYCYLLVLDADSVMAAETMVALVGRMEANPRIGILQVPPLPVRRASPFARWQQFAARVYGPLWSLGEGLLNGPDGNYYGHNAIVRRDAFGNHAGLGALPGSGPFSGPVSSHDFVEAALVRRAGYEVRSATDLGGSYEQCPTTLIDYAVRDQRWCQGNLQHLRVALLPGLAGWSRFHLVRGALAYLIPPLWLAFVGVALLVVKRDLTLEPKYFPEAQHTLFPLWPIYRFADARDLFLMTLGMLFGPRIMGAGWALAEMLRSGKMPWRRVPAFFASLVAEWLMGALLTPALMLFQASFVLAALGGVRVPWNAQRRDERRVALGEALFPHLPHLVSAAVLGIAAYLVSLDTLLWMLPLLLPLAASPLLAVVTSSPGLGRLADRLGLLQVPEDWSTDPSLTVYDRLPRAKESSEVDPRRAWALHVLSVVGSGLVQRLPEERRRELRWRLCAGLPLDEAARQECLTDVGLLLDALAPEGGATRLTPAQVAAGDRAGS